MVSIADRARYFQQFIFRSVGLPFVVLCIFALVLGWRIVVLRQTSVWVERADTVIAQANYTLRLAIDSETGQRGYLVAGDPVFLEPYTASLKTIYPAFDMLTYDARRTHFQVRRITRIRSLYTQWLSEAQTEMKFAKRTPSTYRAYFNEAKGKALMDRVRAGFDQLIKIEVEVRDRRIKRANLVTSETLWTSGVLAALLASLLAIVTVQGSKRFTERYERALVTSQRNQELLSATLFGIGDAVLVTDANGRITMMNAVAEQLTGWKNAEALQKDANKVFNIINESTREAVESPVDRAIREGVVVGLANHTLLVRQDGSEIPIDDSGAPVRDDDGNLVGVVLVFRDISERKKAEVEIAQAYERERRIAANLQRSLLKLPSEAHHSGLDVTTLYQPAWAEAMVGGDFFDVFSLDDDKVALVVGDVSGKGLKAASRTAELKFALRGFLHENGDISSIFNRFNSFVCHIQSHSEDISPYFLCLAVAIVDGKSGACSLCVSGCEPPLMRRADGTVMAADVSGAPIGVIPGYEFKSFTTSLEPGDILLLTTDGLTEARGDSGFLGNNGLAKILTSIDAPKALELMGQQVISEVQSFAGDQFGDDVCLLLARRQ